MDYTSLQDLDSNPWIIDFNKTKADDETTKDTQTFINPFNGCFVQATLPFVEGKRCLQCFGDWLLIFDEETHECFLANFTSCSKISLPPLHFPPNSSFGDCALSSPTPPDCTIMFASYDTFVLYCRPGDKEWTKYDVDFDSSHETFAGSVFGSKGKMYLTTGSNFVVINTTTSCAYVEDMDIMHPSPLHRPAFSRLVESNRDIFFLRFYLHSYEAIGVFNIDVCRLDTSKCVWRRVDSIGDATFFLGANCVAVPSLATGTQADCIYLLFWCCDGIRLYTIRLDDRTISFKSLPACTKVDPKNPLSWTKTFSNLFWKIPQRFKQELTKSLGVITSKFSESVVLIEDKEQVVLPWSRLPLELMELIVPKLSFVDYLHIRAVCKEWSLIANPIQNTRTYPMLMSICAASGGRLRLFDPMVEKQYTLKNNLLLHGNKQTLRFSKDGWVLITKGNRRISVVNPFTGDMFELPKMKDYSFNGISFSSVPKAPDSKVVALFKSPWQNVVDVMLWRAGDKRWTKKELPCDADAFAMAYTNPVFFYNEFYCLGLKGNLGVFNPDDMTWRVLDKPVPIRPDSPRNGDRYCYLVEFKGDLLAILRPYDDNPIEIYKLDQSQMFWISMERLDGAILFLDNWSATIRSSQEYRCCNRIYVPFLGYSKTGDHKVSVFYDMEKRKYKPDFYGMAEPINAIWFEPNFT